MSLFEKVAQFIMFGEFSSCNKDRTMRSFSLLYLEVYKKYMQIEKCFIKHLEKKGYYFDKEFYDRSFNSYQKYYQQYKNLLDLSEENEEKKTKDLQELFLEYYIHVPSAEEKQIELSFRMAKGFGALDLGYGALRFFKLFTSPKKQVNEQ